MPVYRTTGHLTGTIERDNVGLAQAYLSDDDMTRYLDPPLSEIVELVEWRLDGNGHDYQITAVATRELNDDELKELSSWCSGQNSDGLGEGFEQQAFAEDIGEDEVDCINCSGSGLVNDEECISCDGAGYYAEESGGMISFDWKTNELPWTRVK